MKIWRNLLLILLLHFVSSIGQADESGVNLEPLKKILENDMLIEKKQGIVAAKKKSAVKRKKHNLGDYQFIDSEDAWSFLSEFWLVQKAPDLGWDFEKPDYGLRESVQKLFSVMGFFQQKIKILVLKTPVVTHFALPANPNENIFLISLPFMRTLDLTKLEIALIFLEDFFRMKEGHFKKFVLEKGGLKATLGKNFYGRKFNYKVIDKAMKSYTEFTHKKGYTFQQQYTVTKKMDSFLKRNLKLWSAYRKLLIKVDRLVKSNTLYRHYNSIYPSPELQLNWLKPTSGL